MASLAGMLMWCGRVSFSLFILLRNWGTPLAHAAGRDSTGAGASLGMWRGSPSSCAVNAAVRRGLEFGKSESEECGQERKGKASTREPWAFGLATVTGNACAGEGICEWNGEQEAVRMNKRQ
jgi:transcription elongation factor